MKLQIWRCQKLLSASCACEESDEAIYVSELGRLYVDNISRAFYNQANYRIPQPLEPELQLLSTRGVWKRQLLQAD